MNSINIIIPIDETIFGYNIYKERIQPYLDVFGMPYEEVSLNSLCERLNDGASLILLAQPDIALPENASRAIVSAVKGGCGLFATQSSLLENSNFDDFVDFSVKIDFSYGEEIEIDGNHFISRYHNNDKIKLYSPILFYRNACLKDSTVIVTAGDSPLLEVSSYGKGKVAVFHTNSWISTEILGPLRGMDDIFRETIIWAAKKPFVMKGMPPFVGMRVDDVWGGWADKTPENPLYWVDIVNKYNIKPWFGVFTDNTNDSVAKIIKNYVDNGLATAFPHGFSGSKRIGSELPENWLWYDHRNQRPWDKDVMQQRAKKAKDWFDEKEIPISKVALAHFYETSTFALPVFLDWGCEFIGIHMPTDTSYYEYGKLKCGPYRKYEQRSCQDARPVYYADYLEYPNNPEIDKKLFNCVTEIRDVCGYELSPTNDVEDTIKNGVEQLRRAIISGVPATVFTHEPFWIQRITPENWEAEIAGITSGIADLCPIYETLDNINKYVKASYHIKIEEAKVDENGNLDMLISGKNDMDTMCYIYYEQDNDILVKEGILPKNDKSKKHIKQCL